MFQYLLSILGSAYVQIVIFLVLLVYFFARHKVVQLEVSGIRYVRTLILVAVFFYLMFIWASTVQPTLRSISLFGMFLLNLYMFYNLFLAYLAGPYRDALAAIRLEPEKQEQLQNVWHTGKRFYSFRYAWSALFSGRNPFTFLHSMASERVRDDIKNQLRKLGLEQRLISFQMMMAYLKSQLACDRNLPVDFKDVMEKSIENFEKHPWVEEQLNEFLHITTENPEDLNFPEWVAAFERCVTQPR
jgi:hypothetical protein